jgi:CSLREA domain-containing protein
MERSDTARFAKKGGFLVFVAVAGALPGVSQKSSFTAAGATPLVVNSADDIDDGTCDATHCSLREAINAANASAGLDTIVFAIPGLGPHTIQPTSVLPTITDAVIIDGYSQTGAIPNTNGPGLGSNADLMIELDGSLAGAGTNGLTITAGNSTVRGLVINRFESIFAGNPQSRKGIAIMLTTSGGNVIEGNFLGTDVPGTSALENGGAGVFVDGVPGNVIGGTTPQARNIVSGNGGGTSGVGAHGIVLSGIGASGNLVQGNFIGTDITGTVALLNAGSGVSVSAPDNTIGGTAPGAGNLVSGNGIGISIGTGGGTGAERNVVLGNRIGTDVTGTVALGNVGRGIHTFAGGNQTTIGGDMPGAGNVISGNRGDGVLMIGSENKLQGNFIGTDATGTADLGNEGDGIEAAFGHYLIGGTTPDARNVISGNQRNGLVLSGPSGTNNVVQGNYIGTDVTGAVALGNGDAGIRTNAVGLTIGGTLAGAGNVISGNGSHGIFLDCCGDIRVLGNLIGTDVTGTIAMGNGGDGVRVDSSGHRIGGRGSARAGNTIAFNGGSGVFVESNPFSFNFERNAVLANSITANAALGIDLDPAGITPNDAGDADLGPNRLQNYPVLTFVASGAGTTIEGTLNSAPNEVFKLDFFFNSACDPSGHGEGEAYIGSADVTTDAGGDTSFTVLFPSPVPAGSFVTATATDSNNNTSEFSACAMVPPAAALDIKPGSCPNSFNRKSHGVLPVAVVGGEDFDVGMIDLASISLSRADGTGTSVAPNQGPPGPHPVFADVAAPFDGDPCDCHDAGGDGHMDLSLHFRTDEVVEHLELDALPSGALVELSIDGTLLDGTSFVASDCVRLVPPGTSPGMLAIRSSVPGTWVDVSPLDNTLDGGGFAEFQRSYPLTSVVWLTAPAASGKQRFVRWVIDGVPRPEGRRVAPLTIDRDHRAVARYALPQSPVKVRSVSTAQTSGPGGP